MKKNKKSIGAKCFHATILLLAASSLVGASIATSIALRLPSIFRRKPYEDKG